MFDYQDFVNLARSRGACEHEQRRFAEYNAGRFFSPEEAWRRWEPHRLKAEVEYGRRGLGVSVTPNDAYNGFGQKGKAAIERLMATILPWFEAGDEAAMPLDAIVDEAIDKCGCKWGQRGPIRKMLMATYRSFAAEWKNKHHKNNK